MHELILHLGPPKTGTTSIQHTLSILGTKKLIVTAIGQEIKTFHDISHDLFRSKPNSAKNFIDFINKKVANPCGPIIFSSENLSNLFHDNKSDCHEIKNFLEYLKKTFRVTLVYTLTPTRKRIQSTIVESIKQGKCFSSQKDVYQFVRSLSFFDPIKLFELPYTQLCSNKFVIVDLKPGQDAVESFLKSVLEYNTLQKCLQQLVDLPKKTMNISPPAPGIALLHDFNQAFSHRFPPIGSKNIWVSVGLYNHFAKSQLLQEVFEDSASFSFDDFLQELASEDGSPDDSIDMIAEEFDRALLAFNNQSRYPLFIRYES